MMLPRLTDEQVPQYLPKKYYRECADEDGCMTRYRYVTDKPSYLEGADAQYNLIVMWAFDAERLSKQIIPIVEASIIQKLEAVENPYYISAVTAYGKESYNAYPEFAIYQEAKQACIDAIGGSQ